MKPNLITQKFHFELTEEQLREAMVDYLQKKGAVFPVDSEFYFYDTYSSGYTSVNERARISLTFTTSLKCKQEE